MTRAHSATLGAVLVLGLAAEAHADGPPLPNPSMPGPTPPAATAPAPDAAPRSPIRGFFYRITHGSKTPRSAHSDWSTGGDSRLSKPWLQPSGR